MGSIVGRRDPSPKERSNVLSKAGSRPKSIRVSSSPGSTRQQAGVSRVRVRYQPGQYPALEARVGGLLSVTQPVQALGELGHHRSFRVVPSIVHLLDEVCEISRLLHLSEPVLGLRVEPEVQSCIFPSGRHCKEGPGHVPLPLLLFAVSLFAPTW